MRQRTHRESIFVDIGGIAKQGLNKITAADIMNKVTEVLAAERVVTHVLHNAAAVCVGMSLAQIVFGSLRKALAQQRRNLVIPGDVHDLLMGEDRITNT